MRIEVLTLFPELVAAVCASGMPRIAVENGALSVTTRQIRDYARERNRRVDDRPYGGGPGMVMQAEPVVRAIEGARADLPLAKSVMLSPQGERLTQAWLRRLTRERELILLCGRYEGVDERAMIAIDLELSLGDFVLSGGELAAMALIDGIARLLPGVLGDEQSAEQDSFAQAWFDHPHYSRPECWRSETVPEVLLSGDHARIAVWRLKQALGRTWLRRPELLDDVELSEEQTRLLREFIAEMPESKGRERQP